MELLQWMVNNKIQFSKRMKIEQSKLGGVGVFATDNINADSIVLQVPKSMILSPRTCGISNLLEDHEFVGMEGAVLAYIFERRQGLKSPWAPFIASIEATPRPDVPNLWPIELQKQLKGSDLDTMGGLDEEEITNLYEEAAHLFDHYSSILGTLSQEEYTDALLRVSSRAFTVDDYHELALVPGACLFNHTDRPDVHFESFADVCTLCGAMFCECDDAVAIMRGSTSDQDSDQDSEDEADEGSEAESDDQQEDTEGSDGEGSDGEGSDQEELDHSDEEGAPDVSEKMTLDDDASDSDDEDNVCEIRSVQRIPKGKEIMNTYGDESNTSLFARYGFVIWDNANETVNIAKPLLRYAKENDIKPRFKWWKQHFKVLQPDDEEAPSWEAVLEIKSTGEPFEAVRDLIIVYALSEDAFQTLAKQGGAGQVEAFGKIEAKDFETDPTEIYKAVIETRIQNFSAFANGQRRTSHELQKLAKENSDRQAVTLTYLGSAMLLLERAQNVNLTDLTQEN